MSFREEIEDVMGDLKKPFLQTGSWYRMGSRQPSLMGSAQAISDNSISVLACVLIVALGSIQFGLTSLMIAAITNIIGWLAISFARDISLLYMRRLSEGFCVGIISYTVPVYIAEIAPQNMRGGLGSVNQLSVTTGILPSYVLGLFVSWRLLAVLGILPYLILIPGLFFIPKSSRWLIGVGLLALQHLTETNGVIFYSTTIFGSAGRRFLVGIENYFKFRCACISRFPTISTWLVDKTWRRILLMTSTGMAISLLVVAVSFYVKGVVPEDSSL
ncbi:sugar transporter ERD6-like 6 [Olea europaea subsp. europaea]|uniref:Sugar transporter ERD6-like 6 n=1 Tax=Olea europaea subsp. europaea TaxID=158383 RepID=A0A8S0PU61_OLEEU|nr:sugar transporter ERD6-like 6 [Olea europaea subsp. europaea]